MIRCCNSTSIFIRLSGWALILGGIAMLIGGIAPELHSGQYPYNPANYLSCPLDPILDVLPDSLIPSAFLLLTQISMFIFTSLGLMALGYLLQSDSPVEEQPVME